MTALEERLGYSFRNRALLETAVTHSSYANENRASGIVCNERLEFWVIPFSALRSRISCTGIFPICRRAA